MADVVKFIPSNLDGSPDTPDTVELWKPNAGLKVDLVRGYYETVEVRGEDLVIPMRPGMVEFERIAHMRVLLLMGYVQGMGVSDAQRWDRFSQHLLQLQESFDPLRPSGTLQLFAPYYGLTTDMQISCRVENYMLGDPRTAPSFQGVQIQLVSLTTNPVWSEIV